MFVFLALLVLFPMKFAGGGVDKDNGNVEDTAPRNNDGTQGEKTTSDGLFFARVRSLNDVYTPALFLCEVRLEPAEPQWPNVRSDESMTELNVITLIHIRGIDTSRSVGVDRATRPHHEVDRELRRFDNAIRFTRNLIEASGYLLLANPEIIAVGEDGMLCDVFIEFGGQRIDLAEALVKAGHAKWGAPFTYNWGTELVIRR